MRVVWVRVCHGVSSIGAIPIRCGALCLQANLNFGHDCATADLGTLDARMDVNAAGMNFPDVLIIQGKYQMQPPMPFVPGGESAGVVTEVGSAVTRWSVGDSVIQLGGVGGFASEAVVNENALLPKPEGIDFSAAAGVGMTYFTSYYALKQRGQLKAGETLLVMGAAGGVGSTAVELGKVMGAKVIAAASSDEKLELCKQLGADEVINYSNESMKDRIKEITGGKGVDVIYDPVGGDYAEPAVRSMAWNGRYLVIGFASGPIPSIPLNLTLLKGCALIGVFWGRFLGEEPAEQQKNVEELWSLFNEGKLNPVVTDVFPIEQYEAGYAAMMERRAKGKVIFTF